MMGMNENSTDVSVPRAGAMLAEIESTAQPTSRAPQVCDNSVERIACQPSRTLLSPSAALVWLLGSLGGIAFFILFQCANALLSIPAFRQRHAH